MPFRAALVLAFLAVAALVDPRPAAAQMTAADLLVRIDQLENQVRQLTGSVEQLQYRNQQLEQQLRRLQEDTDFRFQEIGGKGQPAPRPNVAQSAPPGPPAQSMQAPPGPPPAGMAGRRSDVFDPSQSPSAPGAPRPLGSIYSNAPPPPVANEPIGAPGGRPAGAPLDLSTMAAAAASDPTLNPAPGQPEGALPPPPPRNPSGTGVATLPPSQSPRDEYDLAYGYLLRKDYALAEESFRDFLKKHPSDRLAGEAHYWLGETLFQRQSYRDAADAFLTVSKKYESSPKAPEALLRLGQSLAALNEKELACATFGEVTRKYPRASVTVKQAVEREQKRGRC
jgi:tol-pal system protein YbgF